MGTDGTQGCAHHQRIRFADEVGLDACGCTDQRGYGTSGGYYSTFARSPHIRVGGNETSTRANKTDSAGNAFEAISGGFTQYYVLRLLVGQNVADVMQCRRQPGFSDNVCSSLWSLIV